MDKDLAAQMKSPSGHRRKRTGIDEVRHVGGGARPRVLLLTGTPGIGKTTVIRLVAAELGTMKLRGFYTEEIREHGERKGFRLLTFDGEDRIIAHVDFPKDHRVGKYGVDLTAIDAAALSLAPDPAVEVYLVDEIGKMECLSGTFVAAMRRLLTEKTPVVATVGLRGGGFIAEVKRLQQCLLWEVTHANRDDLSSQIVTWLAEAAPERLAQPRT